MAALQLQTRSVHILASLAGGLPYVLDCNGRHCRALSNAAVGIGLTVVLTDAAAEACPCRWAPLLLCPLRQFLRHFLHLDSIMPSPPCGMAPALNFSPAWATHTCTHCGKQCGIAQKHAISGRSCRCLGRPLLTAQAI